ncbi:MAG: ABC transporter ATP-binding protein [Methylovirgula sp.]|uniref:ABC transporter ATP-binding protein n=1 Tax=Methylovirgula sp. TaxID=1978224 RepID=UPI0030763484
MTEAAQSQPGEIIVRNVSKSYGHGPFATQVIEDCSFTIEPNKFTVMIGPSGAGKSTLIRLIAGFEKPTRGEIIAGGMPVTGPGKDRLVVFQETALFPWMTTAKNVLYGPQARGEANAATKILIDFLLDKVGLRAFRDRYPAQLSGGMQRRAELARALVNNPAVMILDEPFRGLDAMTKKLMVDYLAKLCEDEKRTNFFVTTDIDEAIFLADRLIVMSACPTKVRAIIEVDLPRPRDYNAIFRDDRANAIKLEALSLLHEEAMKAFAGGSKAAADFIEAYSLRSAVV